MNDVWLLRRKKLAREIPESLVILSSGEPLGDAPFVPDSNFFYLTGIEEPGVVALLRTAQKRLHYTLFWKESDQKQKVWEGPRLGCQEAKVRYGAQRVQALPRLEKELYKYIEGVDRIYCTLGSNPGLDKLIIQSRDGLCKKRFMPYQIPFAIHDLSALLESMRIFKDEHELDCLNKAIAITTEAYRQVMAKTLPGMYEYEVEALLFYVFRQAGAQGLSFPSIVASGANATVLHYHRNDCRIEPNSLLLVDAGAKYNGYGADVTRTWPISGKFNKAQRAIYQAVLDAQSQAIREVRPGVEVRHCHEVAVRVLTEHLLRLGLLSGKVDEVIAKKKFEKFYMHRTGHFLGIDVHDLGGFYRPKRQPRIFEPGMVVTVEPGLYISPEYRDVPADFVGIGVRIEDDVLVTNDGCQILTAQIPKEIEAIEALLQASRSR